MNITKVKYYILFLIVFQFVTEGNSQTGGLKIEWDDDYTVNYPIYSWELYKGDSLISSSKLESVDHGYEYTFQDLPIGVYSFKIFDDGKLLSHRHQLSVIENHMSEYLLYIYASKIWTNRDSTINNIFSVSFDFLTNLNKPSFSPLINREFYAGLLSGKSQLLSKNLEIGIFGGTSFSYTNFKKDTSYFPLKTIKNDHYFSWNFDIATSLRISSNNRRDYNTEGAFLEIGAIYHFPFIFRHSYLEDSKKVTTSHIHQFQNVTAQVKIGYGNVALMASYRLFDYINGNYPELPKLKVGLSVMVSE